MSLIKTRPVQIPNLGTIATAVANRYEREDAEIDDAQLFYGGGEIITAIGRSTERDLHAILASFGVTPKEFNDEMNARVSGRWQFFNGWHDVPETE